MTDDADAYANTWASVFGTPKHRVLLEEPDITKFNELQQQFLQACDEDERVTQFVSYFRTNYTSRTQVWAYCHRMGLHCHHNMKEGVEGG